MNLEQRLEDIEQCWCGSRDFEPFNQHYKKCQVCSTLINTPRQINSYYNVENDDEAFYGKTYWTGHQSQVFGYPDITERSRRDLSERCLYWLQEVLRYKLPPANTLELGSGPGTFVQMMKSAGFNSKGLELSPWVANYGRVTHGVEIINSKLEDVSSNLELNDIIVMMDVLEHFTDPLETMNHVKKVLKDDSIVVIQTPCYNSVDFSQLQVTKDPFLIQLKDQEHLFLLTQEGITKLLQDCGLNYVEFLNPLFPYDMFLVASANPLQKKSEEEVVGFLQSQPDTRLILAMLDLYKENIRVNYEAEARLKSVQTLEQLLQESEADRAARLESIHTLDKLLRESEEDRKARLEIILSLEKLLQEQKGS